MVALTLCITISIEVLLTPNVDFPVLCKDLAFPLTLSFTEVLGFIGFLVSFPRSLESFSGFPYSFLCGTQYAANQAHFDLL